MNSWVPITPEELTIGITVFSRRQYIKRAIASALDQTRPVRVMVIEDCGPDATLHDFVKEAFGNRIEYIRNPRRRGLFDNWNACLEYCRTAWLSILHDDDYLAPTCIESILKLSEQQPGCGLYHGHYKVLDEAGNFRPDLEVARSAESSRRVTLHDLYLTTPIAFAGTVFSVQAVRALGGFNPHSQFAGDWQMWSKVIAHSGGAATRDHVSYVLAHSGADRGSMAVLRSGKYHALHYVQRKRVVALMKRQALPVVTDRHREQVVSVRMLLDHGATMSPRLLRYNLKLLNLSKSQSARYAAAKVLFRGIGWRGVRAAARLWNRLKPRPAA